MSKWINLEDCVRAMEIAEVDGQPIFVLKASKLLTLPVRAERDEGDWEVLAEVDGFAGRMIRRLRCSECGQVTVVFRDTPKSRWYKFCSNCGADMRAKR